MQRPRSTVVLGTLAAWGLVACASSGAVDAALYGDLAALQRSIGEEQRAGDLDRARARELAEAVAARTIYADRGPVAARRIRDLRPCSQPLLPALAARAELQDEGGAEATLVLLGAGREQPESLARRYAEADSGAWRAVAARASTTAERFALRRRYFADPDERVRRAALEAALEVPGALDLDALLEVARLDPDPLSRSLAVRGVGTLGGERAVRALTDLWERADEDVRLTIVEAWSKRRSLDAGGRAALVRLTETGSGVPAVAAAGVLLRVDPSSAGQTLTQLANAVARGSSDEQLLALASVPLEPVVLDAVRRAAHDADANVRIAALERLLELPAERTAALKALREELGTGKGASDAARAALARAGDASVSPALKKALASRDRNERTTAGRALLSLGDYGSAATLLGDGDGDVRVAIACSILTPSAPRASATP